MEPQPISDLAGFATVFVMFALPCATIGWCKYLKYKYGAQPKNTGSPGDGYTLPDEPDDPPPPPPTPPTPSPKERWTSDPTWPSKAMEHVERHNVHMVAVK